MIEVYLCVQSATLLVASRDTVRLTSAAMHTELLSDAHCNDVQRLALHQYRHRIHARLLHLQPQAFVES